MLTLIIAALVLGLDLWTKQLAASALIGGNVVSIFGDALKLVYVENRGAAFGILQGQLLLFLVLTVAILIALLYYLYRRKSRELLLSLAIGLIIGGAIGNLADRMTLGYVVDFIMVDLVDFYAFPVFNVADIGVTTGAMLLALHILMEDRKEKNGRTHRK